MQSIWIVRFLTNKNYFHKLLQNCEGGTILKSSGVLEKSWVFFLLSFTVIFDGNDTYVKKKIVFSYYCFNFRLKLLLSNCIYIFLKQRVFNILAGTGMSISDVFVAHIWAFLSISDFFHFPENAFWGVVCKQQPKIIGF